MENTARRAPYLLFSLVIVVVIGAIGLSLYAVQQRQVFNTEAKGRPSNPGSGKKTSAPVQLYFKATDEFQLGNQTRVDVVMSNSVPVAAADVTVTFPSDVLRVVSVSPGSYLPNVLSGPKVGNGEIMLVAGSSVAAAAEGGGTIATITFETIAAARGNTQIDFGTQTDVAGLGTDANVAFVTDSLRVRVQ